MWIGVIEYIAVVIIIILSFVIPFDYNFQLYKSEAEMFSSQLFGRIVIVVIISAILIIINPITASYIEQLQGTKEENNIFREKARIEQKIKDEKELQDAKDFIKDYKEKQ